MPVSSFLDARKLSSGAKLPNEVGDALYRFLLRSEEAGVTQTEAIAFVASLAPKPALPVPAKEKPAKTD